MDRSPKSGFIFRSYAKKPELVGEIVERALVSARQTIALMGSDSGFVLFVVPMDFDCGETAAALKQAFTSAGLSARVLSAPGHHSCGALNKALKYCSLESVEQMFIVSNKAIDYLDAATVKKLGAALSCGMKVVGVNIPELQDVQESPIQNTLAGWDVAALIGVGGFEAENGVEEVAPLIRLLQKFPRSAGIMPASAWKLNVRASADGKARHAEVKETKRVRQEAEATRLGVSLDWVKESLVHIWCMD